MKGGQRELEREFREMKKMLGWGDEEEDRRMRKGKQRMQKMKDGKKG